MNNSIISIRDLHISYKDRSILNNINLDIKKGEFIYLIGDTGSGKSSLLKSLYKEIHINNGSINILGRSLSQVTQKELLKIRRKIGVVFQDMQLLSDRNIYKNLDFVLRATGWKDKKKISERITEALEIVHLGKIEKNMPYELSGGEQQRASIARALLNHPEIIIADEPTGNLDPKKSLNIIKILKEINDKGTTVIIATHDYPIIEYCINQNYQVKIYKCEDGNMTETNAIE